MIRISALGQRCVETALEGGLQKAGLADVTAGFVLAATVNVQKNFLALQV